PFSAPPKSTFIPHHLNEHNIHLPFLPPAFQIPLLPKKLPSSPNYHPLITLPSLIPPPTSHYHYLSNQLPKPLSKLNDQTNLPLIFPILTTQTIEQPLQTPRTK
ncbi:6,7-dimethyl-8-ribityllumazine synthase, partial [Staphylococcus aureus]|uniref:6,7-dimethyl-8-ribityllumazine synthase n=1 Tax=Staphylococcus aureus TaxID=1280 RepID=UPI001642E965